MSRIIGFKVEVVIQVIFQLLSVIVLLGILILIAYILVLLIKVLRKKSRLLDIELKEKESKALDD